MVKKELTIPKLKKKAQTVFNKYIRLRDQNKDGTWNCISCGKNVERVNAGHFIPIKPYDHLRFNEDNCHAQCIFCNMYAQGNSVAYRFNLIKKIGEDKVIYIETLALNQSVPKFTREDLNEIIKKYK